MQSHSLNRLIRILSRLTAVIGAGIICATAISFRTLTDVLTIKPFFILYGGFLIWYAVAIHRNLTPRLVHQYYSALMVPVAIIPVVAFLGGSGSTTVAKALIALAYFFLVGMSYKFLLARSGAILFGRAIIE